MQHLRPKDFTTEHVACPVCGESRAKILFMRRDHTYLVSSHAFPVVRCRGCGMGYLQDRPTEDSINFFYPHQFYQSNHANYETGTVLRNKLNLLERHASPGKLLDIGCAGGEFVDFATKNGWDGYGYEWSSTPPNYFGSRIIYGDNSQKAFSDQQFDAITAWAVLEHALNLQTLMTNAVSSLKPGGIFLALVTNLNSIPGRLMQQDDIPRHVNLFTKRSMAMLMRQHGLVPFAWNFGNNIFSGSHRGMLVFLAKRLAGEPLEFILAQHREPGRRHEFCNTLNGKPSRFTTWLAAFDRQITPSVDALATKIGVGFTMTVIARKA